MSIRRGDDWGSPARLGAGDPVVGTDAALAALVAGSLGPTGAVPATRVGPVALVGGDLHRTLGGPRRDDLHAAELAAFTCDALLVEGTAPDGSHRRLVAVAHVVAVRPGLVVRRPRLWATPTVVAMNASCVGDADLGPRAHPGDGLVDVTSGTLGPRDRRRAEVRARTGTHVPHPALTEQRVRSWVQPPALPGRLWVRVDGVDVGVLGDLRLTVLPEAVEVLV